MEKGVDFLSTKVRIKLFIDKLITSLNLAKKELDNNPTNLNLFYDYFTEACGHISVLSRLVKSYILREEKEREKNKTVNKDIDRP